MSIFKTSALVAAGAASLIATAPLQARSNNWGRGDGIDVGDVIAGALIIGGIAAVASAASNGSRYGDRYGRGYGRDRDYGRGYERGYGDEYGYNRDGYGSRQSVDQCVRAAQRKAGRYGWARVTDVTSIDRVRGGYQIRGRLVVETRGGRGGYDRGYHYDRYNDGYDKGRFSCVTRYGNIDDVRVAGLRGGYNRY